MKSLLVIVIATAVGVWAQDAAPAPSGLHARELFYSPPSDTTPKSPAKAADKKPLAIPTTAPIQTKAPIQTTGASQTSQPAGGQRITNSDPKPLPASNSNAAAGQPPSASSVPTHTVSATVPLGLRYSVLKRDGAGEFAEVDPDTNFKAGDRIRIQVKANTSGYLYVIVQGSSGSWQVLFPSSDVAGGNNLLSAGDVRQVPPGDRGQFVFDDQGGTEKLFLVLSRQAEPDIDKLIYSMRGGAPGDGNNPRTLMASASVTNDMVDHLRQQLASRDLVFEKVDGEVDGKVEKAAYVVNPSTSADARLVVDVALSHK